MTSLRVGIVSLGEAGNLGDDLILVAVVQAVLGSGQVGVVKYLSFGQQLDWASLGVSVAPLVPVFPGRHWPGSMRNERTFNDVDVVVFGGGGLLQTTHHRDRPFHWLSFLPRKRARTPVLAVGLGLGPLSTPWRRRLARLGSPFDETYLRDEASVQLATRELGWKSVRKCADFVDEIFLRQFEIAQPLDEPRLGVALRQFEGLSVAAAASQVEAVALRHKCRSIEFFVLESRAAGGPDTRFAEKVAGALSGIESTVIPYSAERMTWFMRRMGACSVAVGMKLHACAIWAHAGVPVYPILYAPKVASFYGREYRGMEVVDEILEPSPKWAGGGPRSSDVVVDRLPSLASRPGVGQRFPRRWIVYFQVRSTVSAVVWRVLRGLRSRFRTRI